MERTSKCAHRRERKAYEKKLERYSQLVRHALFASLHSFGVVGDLGGVALPTLEEGDGNTRIDTAGGKVAVLDGVGISDGGDGSESLFSRASMEIPMETMARTMPTHPIFRAERSTINDLLMPIAYYTVNELKPG